jgi:hypothetical protein
MITYQVINPENAIQISINGKVTRADYQPLLPKLEALIRQEGKINILVEMQNLDGIELESVNEELKFEFKYAKDIERCAVVVDKKVQPIAAALVRPLCKGRVKYFDRTKLQDARNYICATQTAMAGANS